MDALLDRRNVKRTDGKIIWLIMVFSLVRDETADTPEVFAVMVIDVTHLRRLDGD